MSDIHLGSGSVEPPRVDGLLRVYSMVFCPYAKRDRLVLKAKNLPHDTVNINLLDKPDWYFKIHPKGQVPALFDEGKTIIESLDISDYLDEKYPTDSPLYPEDAASKENDQEIIRNYVDAATANFGKFLYASEQKSLEETLEILLPPLKPLEDELVKRETPYFGGEKPGMIDFMLWPWAEMAAVLPLYLGVEKLALKDDQIPALRKWVKTMLEVPAVKELLIPAKSFYGVLQARKSGSLDYNVEATKIQSNL